MDLWFYFVLPLTVIPIYLWLSIQEHESYLESICLHFRNGHFHRALSLIKQIRTGDGAYIYEGSYHDRTFFAEYRYRWKQRLLRRFTSKPASYEQLEIRFPVVQKFWMRMILDPYRQQSDDETVVGNSDLDAKYRIHSNQPAAVRDCFSNAYVTQNLARVTFDRFEIHRGWLRISIESPARANFSAYQMDTTVDALCNIAYFYEAQLREVTVIAATQDVSLCPYCRGPLEQGKDSTVACSRCGTKLHQSCWTENGQCTTWGCSSVSLR